MRVKHDCLRETVRALQSLRDQIVIKPEDEPVKTLFEKVGGMENIKHIASLTMKKVLECPILKPYFDSTPIDLHSKRLSYYISYLTGG
jgi:hypothetical protein